MLDMVVSAVAKLREDEGGAKRAKKEEVDSNSKEEPIVPVEFKNVNGEDDGHNNICWDIRTKIRNGIKYRSCISTSHIWSS